MKRHSLSLSDEGSGRRVGLAAEQSSESHMLGAVLEEIRKTQSLGQLGAIPNPNNKGRLHVQDDGPNRHPDGGAFFGFGSHFEVIFEQIRDQ